MPELDAEEAMELPGWPNDWYYDLDEEGNTVLKRIETLKVEG